MEENYEYYREESNVLDFIDKSGNGDGSDLQRLLVIPIENLEQRIRDLKSEIIERREIKEALLRELEHQRRGLEDAVNQLEFDKFNPVFLSRKTTLQSQMLNVEQNKFHEEISCFRDVIMLKEKLRFAEEELRKQREKSKLLLGEKTNGRS